VQTSVTVRGVPVFGIGGPELIVIVILALLLVGPDRLPQVAKTVGTGLRDLRRAANLAQNELRETMEELVREVDLEGKKPPLRTPTPEPSALPSEVASEPVVADPAHERPQGPPADGSTLAVIERRKVVAAETPAEPSPVIEPEVPATTSGFAPVLGTLPRTSAPRRAGSAAAGADAHAPQAPEESATSAGEEGPEPT
jgi:Tat protein translocase TatB subunit